MATAGAAPGPRLECEVLAVVVTLARTPDLEHAMASVRAAATGHDVELVCVVNDPAATGTWQDDGVHYIGAGGNLGWAAGVHAGLLDSTSPYVWMIQDDLTMLPGSLDALVRALEDDPGLASVRPLRVDADGMVQPGSQGWYLDAVANPFDAVPAGPTPADDYDDHRSGDFLLSSGQLIRRSAWDEVGGFDPWFHPWGFVDVDFGRTLRQSGWRFASVPGARMLHEGGGSTTSTLRRYLYSRNQSLYRQKWGDLSEPDPLAPRISPWIVEQSRSARARSRHLTLDDLRSIAGIAAADIVPSMARWIPEDAARLAASEQARQSLWSRLLGR